MIYDVVIVGAGFSAISLLANLLPQLSGQAAIAVVSDDSGFGRGTAYRTELHLHRLNVPAGRMSAFPSKPNDFLEWLQRRGRDANAASFVSRHDYGLYMRDTLASLLRPQQQRARVDFVKSRAKGLRLGEGGEKHIRLANGEVIIGSNIVLCLGLGTASLPRLTFSGGVNDAQHSERLVENPWRLGWLSNVKPEDSICILGSGLTMVDQVLALRAHGHLGPIRILSRRGLLPHKHSEVPVHPISIDVDGSALELSEILRLLRIAADDAPDWRCVMEGLRHHTQHLWQQFSSEKRSRFLRHALAWWNIHRHRLSPEVARSLKGFMDDGGVSVSAGYLHQLEASSSGVVVKYRPRGSTGSVTIEADWLVNCTGMERAGIAHSPLLQSMKSENLVSLDPHGLGLEVDESSNVLDGKGDCLAGVYAVGGLTAGRFWEITAVPDIRVQVAAIATTIAQAGQSS
jgi:uncharacterized NAD(P)/FAD-binding protein YdhS